jgi:type IV secretion system protein VirB11
MKVSYYLAKFLSPLTPLLDRADITDIWINRPQEIWFESLGGRIERLEALELTERSLEQLARQVAAASSQGISREFPILSAALPSGERIQIVAPPATRGGIAIAIRKHVSAKLSLSDYEANDAFVQIAAGAPELLSPSSNMQDGVNSASLLREGVRARKNILISGGTSSGKTTFANALVKEIPETERLIFIEDTPEMEIVHANAVGLLAARSELSEARVNADDLLNASLRMRPDRIILGEVRGPEAFTFLRAINTGHPGSLTTIHADSPVHAIDQLALLVLQSGTRLAWTDVVRYVRSTIDIYVQLERRNGKRGVAEMVTPETLIYDENLEVQSTKLFRDRADS